MTNIKKLFAAAVFIGGAGFMASSAQAAPIPAVSGTPTVATFNFGGGSTYTAFTDVFTAANFNKTFSDMIPFNVAINPSTANGFVGANYLLVRNTVFDLDITAFNVLNSAGTIVATGTNYNLLSNITHTKDDWRISNTVLTPGNYNLNIAGKVTGAAGGNYTGEFNIAAVPEPETYGMLLSGLGLIGFIARRKSAAKKAA